MSSFNLIRWSDLTSMVGGTLLIVSDFLELLLAGYELDEAATTGTYGGVTVRRGCVRDLGGALGGTRRHTMELE